MKLIKLMILGQMAVLLCAAYVNLTRDKNAENTKDPVMITAESYFPAAHRTVAQWMPQSAMP